MLAEPEPEPEPEADEAAAEPKPEPEPKPKAGADAVAAREHEWHPLLDDALASGSRLGFRTLWEGRGARSEGRGARVESGGGGGAGPGIEAARGGRGTGHWRHLTFDASLGGRWVCGILGSRGDDSLFALALELAFTPAFTPAFAAAADGLPTA